MFQQLSLVANNFAPVEALSPPSIAYDFAQACAHRDISYQISKPSGAALDCLVYQECPFAAESPAASRDERNDSLKGVSWLFFSQMKQPSSN